MRVRQCRLVLPLLLPVMACSRSAPESTPPPAAPPAPAAAASPGAAPPAVQQVVMESVVLGKNLSKDGSVTEATSSFRKGDPVFVSLKTTPISPGTEVKLVFYGPQGQPVGQETLVVPPGASVVNFKARDTDTWATGQHRIEVWLGGAKAGEETFTVS